MLGLDHRVLHFHTAVRSERGLWVLDCTNGLCRLVLTSATSISDISTIVRTLIYKGMHNWKISVRKRSVDKLLVGNFPLHVLVIGREDVIEVIVVQIEAAVHKSLSELAYGQVAIAV